MKKLQGFISYSHDDKSMCRVLLQHFAPTTRAGGVEFWADPDIVAGDRFREKIDARIARADFFVLLFSPSFNSSKFIEKVELPAILDRAKTDATPMFPIQLKACIPLRELRPFQMVPKGHQDRVKPIDQWAPRGRGFEEAHGQLLQALERKFPGWQP